MLSELSSVVNSLQTNISEASLDLQIDQKREHKKKFYEILDADTIEKQLRGEATNKYWMMNEVEYIETFRQIEGLADPELDKLAYHRRHTLINNYEVLNILALKTIIKKTKDENSPVQFLVNYEDFFESLYPHDISNLLNNFFTSLNSFNIESTVDLQFQSVFVFH